MPMPSIYHVTITTGAARDSQRSEAKDELVALVRDETHSCYLGDRTQRHPWGYGCDECPACVLRRAGWEMFAADRNLS